MRSDVRYRSVYSIEWASFEPFYSIGLPLTRIGP